MSRRKRSELPMLQSLPEFVLEPVADALLPWGDPYIIKLAQQLERDAKEQIEAAFRDTEDEDEDWAPREFRSTYRSGRSGNWPQPEPTTRGTMVRSH